MSYLVLARKYRPQDFTTVTGQEHVTRTLSNAIRRDKVAHAHLFCGPRGVGKTSIARIFAKALNCAKGPTAEPCLECQNCKEITAGTSLSVREIDGASHNSVDNVRDLIESFRALPPPGSRFKVYIIDEVHMLSVAAFNALLKSLEEPPPNTIFVLATTEVHKIPETVISRCVRHDFRALSPLQIETRLREVAESEKLAIEPEVLRMITRISDGSMRDAQSLLDRVQSFCDTQITAVEASRILGTVERSLLFQLAESVLSCQPSKVLALIGDVFQRGVDLTIFLRELVIFWRELLIGKVSGAKALEGLGLSSDEASEVNSLVNKASLQDLEDLVQIVREGADAALRSSYGKYALEALLVRMASREPSQNLRKVIEELKGIARTAPQTAHQVSGASSVSQPVAASPHRAQQVSTNPEAVASPEPRQETVSTLSWADFVNHALTHGARILTEHLKRLSVQRFTAGQLEARGPKFSIASLERADNLERLKKALTLYSGSPQWKINLQVSEQESEPGSLQHAEQTRVQQKRKDTEASIVNHPKIKSLQRVFPGSSIEDIKVEE